MKQGEAAVSRAITPIGAEAPLDTDAQSVVARMFVFAAALQGRVARAQGDTGPHIVDLVLCTRGEAENRDAVLRAYARSGNIFAKP